MNDDKLTEVARRCLGALREAPNGLSCASLRHICQIDLHSVEQACRELEHAGKAKSRVTNNGQIVMWEAVP